MERAIFKKYQNGYYHFLIDDVEEMIFEEASAKVLNQFDLKTDSTLVGMRFLISYSEYYEDDEELVVYRLETLKLL
jgi:hypothetical protein